MPIYAYRCGACGHQKDVLQKLSDAPLVRCPACGAEAFSKQVTAAGFQLKGSGWYVTDFRNNGATKPADKPADKSAEGSGDKGAAAPADAASKGGSADKPAAAPSAPTSTPAPAPASSSSSTPGSSGGD